jgi:hypothetical protein
MKKGLAQFANPLKSFGWGKGSRTPIHGVRVRCPTIERSPIFSSEFGVQNPDLRFIIPLKSGLIKLKEFFSKSIDEAL